MDASKLIRHHDALKSDRLTWDSRWQNLAEWLLPHKAYISEKQEPMPTMQYRSYTHDSKGIKSAETLASAHVSYITPTNEIWMNFAPPRELKDNDAAVKWYRECSEIVLDELMKSNFYQAVAQVYKDRAIFGTGSMMVTKGDHTALEFTYLNCGEYCFTEDKSYRVQNFYREFEYTLEQAVDEWGEDELGETLRKKVFEAKEKPELWNQRYKFLQVIKPRKERDYTKENTENKAFAEYYVCLTDKKVLAEGGYDEHPSMVTRYEKWGNYVWGFSPAYNAMPNIRGANYIRQILKTVGEVKAIPRILRLASSKTQIDYRAGGVSYVSNDEAQLGFPREWGTDAQFDIGLALLEMDHSEIEEFFHIPLFRMFAQIDKQMTATEIAAREREKLLLFAPSFTQFVDDFSPQMVRVFNMLAREGMFPEPPPGVFEEDGEALAIPTPKVVFRSRVALAIQALQSEGFDRVAARLMPFMEFSPEILDNIDFDKLVRDMFRIENIPEAWLKSEDEIEEMRAARQEAMMQQQQMEQMQMAAQASGQANPENIEQLEEMANEQ